jgi:hypothetical protein
LPAENIDVFNDTVSKVNELISSPLDMTKLNESQLHQYARLNVIAVKSEEYVKNLLLVVWIVMINAYYLAYFNIESLKGNVFVNAITLGLAETIANFASGLLLLRVKEDVAYRICCIIGIIANFALLYPTTHFFYVVLFLAVGGLGGMFNCLLNVIEMQVAPKSLGPVMQIIFTVGSSMSCFVSVMATLDQPLPIFITAGLVFTSLMLSLLLPEGGRYLPKAVKVSESVTIIDVLPI